MIKKHVKERLVEIETGDQTVEFGLFEPQKIKPFLNKYHVGGYALNKDDAFSLLK